MRKTKFSLTFMALLLVSLNVGAGVNLRNGNFYVTYTDISVPGGGKPLELTRTYNSRSSSLGWFGWGWGSDFETKVVVSADSSVIVHENGSGATTRFVPKSSADPKVATDKIMANLKNVTGKVADELREKLMKDQELRMEYEKKLNIEGKLADGQVLYSNERGMQEIHKIKDGYKRLLPDGKVEFFNSDGKLSKIKEKSGYEVEMVYKTGALASIKDNQAKQIYFDWYPDGRVKNVWSAGDKKVEYKYSKNDLAETKDVGDNLYKYSYDAQHNMTQIAYSDKTSLKLSYDKNNLVTSVTDRGGETTKYEYGANSKNPNFHYWTTVTASGYDGKPIKNKYEYEIKSKPDGSQYTYRLAKEINGVKEETIYSECCGQPLKIQKGNEVTNFEYNSKGLMTKKNSTNGEYANVEYDEKTNKISKVVNNGGWIQFSYDGSGNLTKAQNSQGKQVYLHYDRNNRITTMVDSDSKTNDKKKMTFEYNAGGKPVEIAIENVGKINVEYDNYGEVKKVESKAGHKMALQVYQFFQNLSSIVRPAGVNLQL